MTGGGTLGRTYRDGEVVVRQGDEGDSLFVVVEGELEAVRQEDGRETVIRRIGRDELFGEMAVFERQRRSATVRARGEARVLTLDKKNFLRRVNEDPSLAFRIVETMSRRVRELSARVVELERQLSGKGGGGA